MPLFHSATIKNAANRALTFSTLYLATGLIVNTLGPVAGSLCGLFMTRKEQCERIAVGHKIGKMYFFPITEAYKHLHDAAHSFSQEEKRP